jgi:hypothetical protein
MSAPQNFSKKVSLMSGWLFKVSLVLPTELKYQSFYNSSKFVSVPLNFDDLFLSSGIVLNKFSTLMALSMRVQRLPETNKLKGKNEHY